MTEFKQFDTHTAKLSEIAAGSFKVPVEHQPAVNNFVKTLLADVLLMRKDVEVEFGFNLNMGQLYFWTNKSFPFIPNDHHEFLYPLDGSKTIAEVIDEAVEEAAYHKSSLPLVEFKDMFENIKAFDDLFEFNGELYAHMKKSSFSYTNMGHKDVFNGIEIVRIFGHTPGVSLKMNGMKVNVNNGYWNFDFDGVTINVNKEQIQKADAAYCIKNSVLGLYNLSKGTAHKTLDFVK